MANLKIIYPDIPVSASAVTSNATFTDTEPLINLEDGGRSNIATSSSADVLINHDLGSATAAANHFVIARADKITQTGNLRIQGSSASRFTPSTISGLVAWYDANRGMTVDADNLVGQWNDLSGNGNHATQGTAANKPILSRWDNKENLVKYSEQFNQSEWVKSRSAIAATNTVAAPDGTITAEKLVDSTDAGVTHRVYQVVSDMPLTSYRATIYCKAAELNRVRLAITSQNETLRNSGDFDLSSGTLVSGSGSISSVGSGWYRLEVTGTTTSPDTGVAIFLYLMSGGVVAYTGTGTDGVYIWGGQLSEATADATYLQTTAYPKQRAANGNRSIFFDGIDDNLRADSVATGFSGGQDYPMTLVFVSNAFQAASPANATWLGFGREAANTGWLFARVDTGNRTVAIRDDAATIKTATFGAPTGGVFQVHAIVISGTQVTWYVNGAIVGTANQDINVGVSTRDRFCIGAQRANATTSNFFRGKMSEVLIYNTSLSSTDRQAVEAYLATKWQTAPVLLNTSLGGSTKVGPRSNDYVASFTTTSAFRHWWVEHYGTTAFKPSKLYLGQAFDPAVDCDFEWSLNPVGSADFIADSGERRAGRISSPRYSFTLSWAGLTDAEVNIFSEKIWKRKHKSTFFLYASGQGQVLDNKTLVHVRVTSAEWERVGKANYNVLRATFEEVL